jgi:hypothetical protein
MSDFEDPTQLARCIKSDCQAYRAGGTPLCAAHLHEQEKAAGATAIIEPEVEARVAKVRTEDDDHPGMVKVYDKDTGKPSWVPAAQGKYVGPDPDTNGLMTEDEKEAVLQSGKPSLLRALGVTEEQVAEALRLDVPTWNQRVGIDRPPDTATMTPVWNDLLQRWVLEPNTREVDLNAVRSLVRDLMHELGIREEGGDDHV